MNNLVKAVATDLHFWVPVLVLITGIVLLLLIA